MRACYILLTVLLLAAAVASAQTRADSVVYTGRVVNPAAVPLAGASVLLKGTVMATSTNAEGMFRFAGPAGPQVVVVSYPQHLTVHHSIAAPDSAVVIVLHSIRPRVTAPSRRKKQE
ncbi:carboxypeptidase regulatory-like domain-containing protein [Hymenobacter swuensis]|uniref:Carboxypeptidase-like regulatory domain-containing protein n=1 Tax=Hymenobacter swuensis DY53 TaxID=1227739 RepID=W8F360_9BACT|nr:carboxypeptidase regulatory-like domain-containing protein [Hymenobacter swuensis]AHJ99388.1 hypothetical protein Hsw_3793 [Hymenobacter swuensis DY53]